ncbi:histone chaperone ASF1-like [Salvia divinorum]|uniref:Histone chaperone ASF1-like n=1 Tax=Salvia divinorum TaxID=28513 RepID=A0ABD1GJW2_SALDI
MWCMTKQRKVHLGYWLAHTCNQIAAHAIRNLNTCHILGEFLKRNVVMKYTDDILPPTLCPKPEIFGITFFIKEKIVKIINEKYYFYTTEEIDDPQTKTLAITEGKAGKTPVEKATEEKKDKKME